jgi:putative flippase GtrA
VLVKFVSFALVGIVGTLAHYLVLYALVELQGFDPVTASGCGALAGLLVNYVLNFKWTFNSDQSHSQTFPKFAVIAVCGMGLNLLLMTVFTPHFYYFFAQLITTALVLFWNFLANFLWTFKMDTSASASHITLTTLLKKPFTLMGLLLTVLSIRVLTLGFYPLYDPSESRYSEMARKMWESGNWVTPMIDYGVPFWGKPPLTIWLSAVSLGIGGVNDFAVRTPSLLLGIGIVWIVFYLLRLQRGLEQGLLAALILSGSVLFFVMSGTVAMDQCLSFGITLALAAFWLALREQAYIWGYVFFLGLSIGLLAKGPITLVLCGITIFFWTLFTGRWLDIWQRIPWISGTLLMLVLCVPWYLLAENSTPGFLEYFFIGEHWKRFTESGWKGDLYGVGRDHPRGIIWLYWLGAAFPWSLLLLYRLINSLLHKDAAALVKSKDNWQLYCLLWMLSPLVFFTFSANLIWTYVLPGLPGMALLLAGWLGGLKGVTKGLSLIAPVGFLAVVIFYNVTDVDFYKSQKRLIDTYQHEAIADERLIYLKNRPYSAQFYLAGKSLELNGVDALEKSLNDAGHDFYVLRVKPTDENTINFVSNSFEALVGGAGSATAASVPVAKVLFDDELPEAVRSRLQPVKAFGRYMLFHAVTK